MKKADVVPGLYNTKQGVVRIEATNRSNFFGRLVANGELVPLTSRKLLSRYVELSVPQQMYVHACTQPLPATRERFRWTLPTMAASGVAAVTFGGWIGVILGGLL